MNFGVTFSMNVYLLKSNSLRGEAIAVKSEIMDNRG
jgi:hypothetical protein